MKSKYLPLKPEAINDAKAWLAEGGANKASQEIIDILDEALECAMDKALEYRPWSERSPRQWSTVERIHHLTSGEGWCFSVYGDGMLVIGTDEDHEAPIVDAYSYVEHLADGGSLVHQIALGLHGMIMTEES